MILKVISGGQTGVDRAALDAAMELGLPIGGWCPAGRRAEDGKIPDCYPLEEVATNRYDVRTRKNVMASHATLVIADGDQHQNWGRGTKLTVRLAGEAQRKGAGLMVVGRTDAWAASEVLGWLGECFDAKARSRKPPRRFVLNVGGPRESSKPGIGEEARMFLLKVLSAFVGLPAKDEGVRDMPKIERAKFKLVPVPVMPPAAVAALKPAGPLAASWAEHELRWGKGCGSELCSRASHVCLGRGTVPADVLLVGEAPGQSEDTRGIPFDGPAGDLLDRILAVALAHLPQKVECCFTNLVGCIPLDDEHGKGEPDDLAVRCCSPRLQEAAWLCDPKLVICVGDLARDWLDPGLHGHVKLHPICEVCRHRQSSASGTWRCIDGHEGLGVQIPQVAVNHPARILRTPVAHRANMRQRCEILIEAAVEEHVLPWLSGR